MLLDVAALTRPATRWAALNRSCAPFGLKTPIPKSLFGFPMDNPFPFHQTTKPRNPGHRMGGSAPVRSALIVQGKLRDESDYVANNKTHAPDLGSRAWREV
jgi:hypothetical protein